MSNHVYRVQVRAVNEYGAGPWSIPYNVTSPIVSSPVPVSDIRLISSSESSLSIGWTIGSSDGNQGQRNDGKPSEYIFFNTYVLLM